MAFFAIGAYTVGLLTSYGQYGLAHVSFWVAAPIAVLVAFIAGAFLGLPVLGIRGDYLAIATLGFGEIVRILAGSDWLAPWLGGPQGIIGIQKPCLGFPGAVRRRWTCPRVCHGFQLGGPVQIYYLAVFGAALIAVIAWRLRESRVGRAWMAIREDEDVAEALGVYPDPEQDPGLHAWARHSPAWGARSSPSSSARFSRAACSSSSRSTWSR